MHLRLTLLACLTFVACGDDDHHHHATGSCGEIVDACHDVDTGSGPISDCHATGHDGDEAACDVVVTSCVALCAAGGPDAGVESDAGEAHDAGESDAAAHEHDGGAGHAH